MNHKTSRLVPNILAQTSVVLDGCCMKFSEYVCNIQVAIENIFYNSKFQPWEKASNLTVHQLEVEW
jgi:hypothetical protein